MKNKFDDLKIQLASCGLLTANCNNMQPLEIKLATDKDGFYLFSGREHLTKKVDPFARQTMITQSIFLNL